jgi:hypothetical protein
MLGPLILIGLAALSFISLVYGTDSTDGSADRQSSIHPTGFR